MKSTILKSILLGLVAVLVAGGFLAWKVALDREGTRIEALFDSTVGLYPGSDVEILGVPVGTVTDVVPEGSKVRVSMKLDRGQQAGADSAAVIIAPTLVSDRFVQLTEPYDGGAKLQSGTVLSGARTAVPVEIDELYASLNDVGQQLGPNGANANGALSELLDVAADNLDGQGAKLNEMVAEFGKATGTLANSDADFFDTVSNLKEFNDMLVANDRTLADANRQFASVADYLADDRQDLSAAVANLGDALGIVDNFIRDNRGNLKTSVDNLIGPTKVLVDQRESLDESVRLIPLVLQNFLRAYGPSTNTLDGRVNLNELTIWSGNRQSAKTSESAPPALLPGLGDNR
ncbi:MAG: MCE family protein [Kineosporiaceae bacterium]|nr:MCE family protein [Aeromicrobium sp.]